MDDLHAVAAWRAVGLWAGRRTPGYGPGTVGSVAISGAARFDGAGVFLVAPWRPPVVHPLTGPVHLELFASRLHRSGETRHPWFAGARLSGAPASWLQLGVNRGVMFGGDGGTAITLERLLRIAFVGNLRRQGHDELVFANQVLSFDAVLAVRPGGLPLRGWLEWGTEDASGAIGDVPGVVAGVELAAWPGAPWLSAGVERASFAHSCCSNPPWAQHIGFSGGWTASGRLIGHPLGGSGTSTTAYASADALDARLRVVAAAGRRRRGDENLFSPTHGGPSTAASLAAQWSPRGRLQLEGAARIERGARGWTEAAWSAAARLRY